MIQSRRGSAMPDSAPPPIGLLNGNLCSVPFCLQPIFSASYGVPLGNQVGFSQKNGIILTAAMRALSRTRNNFNANALIDLMCVILAEYKKNRSRSPQAGTNLHQQLLRQNHPKSPDYQRGNLPSTLFSAEKDRAILNFLVLHNALLQTQDVTAINLGEFCERAARYLDIHLIEVNEHPAEIIGVHIAKIKKEKGGGYSHRFHGLNAACPDMLFYIYDQLLDLILRGPSVTNDEKLKKLNAVFLLTFLIGSNAPMHRDGAGASGGAFVTDVLSQILLLAAGFKPMRKNYLNLTEIQLLYFYATDSKACWDEPVRLYLEAFEGTANLLFHPISLNEHDALGKFLLQLPQTQQLSNIDQLYYQCNLAILKLMMQDNAQCDARRALFFDYFCNNHSSDNLICGLIESIGDDNPLPAEIEMIQQLADTFATHITNPALREKVSSILAIAERRGCDSASTLLVSGAATFSNQQVKKDEVDAGVIKTDPNSVKPGSSAKF
jgi:hypothetical protein